MNSSRRLNSQIRFQLSVQTNWQPLRLIAQNRLFLFILFLVCELSAFVIIPASTRWGSTAVWQLLQLGISLIFLISILLLRRVDGGQDYVPIFHAFFVASLSILISLLLGGYAHRSLGVNLKSASGIATAKLIQCVLRILPLFFLIWLADKNWKSLYLYGGRLGPSLIVGLIAFTAFGVLAYLPWIGDSEVLRKLFLWTPWVLLFILANAIEEELLFRGLFLKRYGALLGKPAANLLTAVTFTLVHIQATYASDIVQLLLILFPLALAFGYLIQKTNSLWGSVLFHAGADLLIIVAAYAVL